MTLARAILSLAAAAVLAAAVACAGSGGSSPLVRVTPERDRQPTVAEAGGPPASQSDPHEPEVFPTVRRPGFVILADLTTNVPVPELPAAFAAPAPDPALAAILSNVLGAYAGSYSAVVHNLADGRYAALNEGRVYYAASLYKLGVLLEAYRQREAGELDFSMPLTLEEKYVAYDLGTLELLGLQLGDTITVADALKAMIVVSDTPGAVMVQDTVKPARVDATLRSLGIRDTSFNDYDLPATARDMAQLLEAVAAGEGVLDESRREMLSLLLQETIREGIPAGAPPDAAVAHKTGNWENATHDVALVWGPGGPYIIAVMSDQPWTWEPLVELSQAVWDYFAAYP